MRRVGIGPAAVTLMVILGCGSREESPVEPDAPETDLRIAVAGGNHQQAPVGTTLQEFLVARVTDGPDLPVEDVRVEWEVVQGGGELSLKGHLTDRQGLSAAVLFLGDEPGDHVVRAFLENGREARFMATAVEAGSPPAALSPL